MVGWPDAPDSPLHSGPDGDGGDASGGDAVPVVVGPWNRERKSKPWACAIPAVPVASSATAHTLEWRNV